MSFEYNENELMVKIKRQNPTLNYCDMKIIKIYNTKRYNKTLCSVKININFNDYTKIMNMQKMNTGWERCRIFDGLNVRI